jgi:hypothetical protein
MGGFFPRPALDNFEYMPEFEPLQEFQRRGSGVLPPWDDVFAAAFRQENSFVSMAAWWEDRSLGVDDDPQFDAHDPELNKGTVFENNPTELNGIRSMIQWDRTRRRIEQQTRDRNILQRMGTKGMTVSFIAQGLDLLNFVPIGGALMFGGATLLKTAARTAWAGFAGSAITEVALQATQDIRTVEETILGISAGTVFGGILGATLALPIAISKRAIRELGTTMAHTEPELAVRLGDADPAAPTHSVLESDVRLRADGDEFDADAEVETPTMERWTQDETGKPC